MEIKIKEIRESLGLTQDEIAEKMNITQPVYARFENQNTKTDLQRVEDFAKALNMSVIDVIGYPDRFVNVKEIGKEAKPEMTLQIKVPEEKWGDVLFEILGNKLELLKA